MVSYRENVSHLKCPYGTSAGGLLVGLTLGYVTLRLLRLLRWHGASTFQEVAAIQALGYLAFYVANAPLQVSGAGPSTGAAAKVACCLCHVRLPCCSASHPCKRASGYHHKLHLATTCTTRQPVAGHPPTHPP